MREYIIKFDTDKPLSELASGTNVRALMKVTGDCDEIVRCKDCKHYYRFDGRCYLWCINRRENGYCDRAERREE